MQNKIFKKPIFYILIYSFIQFFIGINWGLPNTDTWLSDSLAPYQPLVGLSQGFSFGYYYKYPLVHQIILAICNLPVVIVAFINTYTPDGLDILKLINLIRSPEYSSWLIFIDALVSIIMGVLIIYVIYLSAKELFNEKVALYTAIITVFNAALNFYAHVAKVEVPFIFWGLMALYSLIKIIKYDNREDYIYCAIFTSLSYGSKDQGYAIFVLPFILYLIVYQAMYRNKQVSLYKAIFRKNLSIFVLYFIIGFIVVENLLLNSKGLLKRLFHLLGEGGVRSIGYDLNLSGIISLFYDSMRVHLYHTVGEPLFIICIIGIFLFLYEYRNNKKELFIKSIYIFASISFYIFFVQIIRQSNVRFQLPQSIFLSVYGGFAIYYLFEKLKGNYRKAFIIILIPIGLYSFYNSISVNANLLLDSRYKAEEWMEKNMPENSVIEYYAYKHYLPRFPEKTKSYRIKNRVANIEKRNPDYIVLSSHYYPRFLLDMPVIDGRIKSMRNIRDRQSEFAEFLPKLFNNKLNYRLVKKIEHNIPFFKKTEFSRVSPDHILIYQKNNSVPCSIKLGINKIYGEMK